MAIPAPQPIVTSRLRLLPATEALLRASLSGNEAFAVAVGRRVPASWPPEHFDTTAVNFTLDWLRKHPADAPWGFYCIELPDENGAPGTLIGAGGFKGGPELDGIVEIGYSVLPEFQRRGYALESVRGWVEFAFSHPKVQMICAHTLASGAPSIGVLRKAGFVLTGRGHDSGAPPDQEVVRFELAKK
jgi:[ribosomal protein S5]-alanine N-acetyltransferase